jgi:hypothetical protein
MINLDMLGISLLLLLTSTSFSARKIKRIYMGITTRLKRCETKPTKQSNVNQLANFMAHGYKACPDYRMCLVMEVVI